MPWKSLVTRTTRRPWWSSRARAFIHRSCNLPSGGRLDPYPASHTLFSGVMTTFATPTFQVASHASARPATPASQAAGRHKASRMSRGDGTGTRPWVAHMGWLRVLWVVTDAAGVRCRSLYRLTRAMTGPPGSATTDAIVVPGHRSRRAPRIAPGGRPTPRFELNPPPEGVS